MIKLNDKIYNEILVDLDDYFYQSLDDIKARCEEFLENRPQELPQIECFAVEIHQQCFQQIREFILRKKGGESFEIFGNQKETSFFISGNLTEN